MSEDKVDACPCQSGKYTAYQVEINEPPSKDWRVANSKRVPGGQGIPAGKLHEGTNMTLNMFNYEQAMALAWLLKSEAVAAIRYDIGIRVVPYQVEYDVKAWKLESEAEELPLFGPQKKQSIPEPPEETKDD